MSKKKFMVLSVYCPDIEIYPYSPFIAENMYDAIQQYIKFLHNKDKICPNPELHLIGYAYGYNQSLNDIQPLLAPQKVILSDNFLAWTIVTLANMSLKLQEHLFNITRRKKR